MGSEQVHSTSFCRLHQSPLFLQTFTSHPPPQPLSAHIFILSPIPDLSLHHNTPANPTQTANSQIKAMTSLSVLDLCVWLFACSHLITFSHCGRARTCVCTLPLFLLITQAVFRLHIDPVYAHRDLAISIGLQFMLQTQKTLYERKKNPPN